MKQEGRIQKERREKQEKRTKHRKRKNVRCIWYLFYPYIKF